jgi:hypothetical protein
MGHFTIENDSMPNIQAESLAPTIEPDLQGTGIVSGVPSGEAGVAYGRALRNFALDMSANMMSLPGFAAYVRLEMPPLLKNGAASD